MRLSLTIIFSFISPLIIAQNYCDCDTIKGKYRYIFNGYCNEYLDYKLNIVSKDKAQFKNYVYYKNGKKLYVYPVLYRWEKNQKNYLNGKLIEKVDSIILLNGILESFKKDSSLIECYNFQNGRLIKDVDKYWSIFHSKKYNGNKASVIVEYDYSTGFIRRHYIHFRKDGTLKCNLYAIRAKDGNWYDSYYTKTLMTDDIKTLNIFP